MVAVTVGQTTSLIIAITGLIAALGSVVAAVLGALNRRSLATPSGPSIGKQVESAHLTAIANNHFLANKNGPTKPATEGQLQAEVEHPPLVPAEHPDTPTVT